MAIEIQYLAWAIVLGFAQLLLADLLMTRQRGMAWNASARDGDPAPLTGAAGRADRAFRNFLETFPFFAAAVLAVVATGRGDGLSALGVQLYVWARLVYVPLYIAGIPYLRSLVWVVAMVGGALVVRALF